jgi:hypothetical protein
MGAARLRRPVLVVAGQGPAAALRNVFSTERLQGWEPREATDVLHARFLLQCGSCEVMLVDSPGPGNEEDEALCRLAARHGVPVVVLAGGERSGGEGDGAEGWHLGLPRDLALAHPDLLGEAFAAAARCRRLQREAGQAAADLRECGRRADRLAALLWEVAAGDHPQWLTQRSLMGRLEQELARAHRQRVPLGIVIGEVREGPDGGGEGGDSEPRTWVIDRIARGKRRSDVSGQYGPRGFLLLLPDTPAEGARTFCRRMEGLLREAPAAEPGGREFAPPHIDFGVAAFPEVGTAAGLLCRAEERLEEARGDDGKVDDYPDPATGPSSERARRRPHS